MMGPRQVDQGALFYEFADFFNNICHERTLAPWLSSDRKSYGNLGEYN
jgi:hypothetical protein